MSEQFEFGERVQVYPIHNNWKPARYISRTSGCHCVLVDGEVDPSFYAQCRRPVRTIRIGEREVNAPLYERPKDPNTLVWKAFIDRAPQPGSSIEYGNGSFDKGLIYATDADARAAADALLELLREPSK